MPAKNAKVKLHHISWTQLVSTAVRLHEHIGVQDAEQRWLLEELIRYPQHSASGALSFNDMGPAWVAVRNGTKDGRGSTSFIESVEEAINGFYDQVLSRLTAWQPKASPRQPVAEPSDTQTFEE